VVLDQNTTFCTVLPPRLTNGFLGPLLQGAEWPVSLFRATQETPCLEASFTGNTLFYTLLPIYQAKGSRTPLYGAQRGQKGAKGCKTVNLGLLSRCELARTEAQAA